MKTRSLCAGIVHAFLIPAAAAILTVCAPPLDNRGEGNLRIVLSGEASSGARAISPEIEAGLSYRLDFSGPGEEAPRVLEPGTGNLTLTLDLGQWTIRVEAYQGEVFYGSGETTVVVEAGRTNDATIVMKTAFTDITAFGFADPLAIGIVDRDAKTIAVTVPFGTDVTNLIPTIEFEGSSVSPASGSAQNFANPAIYTVTAADGSTAAWTVTVEIALNTAKEIAAFSFADPLAIGIVDGDAKAIAVTVPFGTDLDGLVPTISHLGANISPASGLAQNFANPVIYTVTAADGSTADWTVTVTVFSFAVEGPGDLMVPVRIAPGSVSSTDISWSGNESLTFTVDAAYTVGGGNLKWLVNGEAVAAAGNSLTIHGRDYVLRTYTLTAMIKAHGQWYSGNYDFTVVR